MAAKRLYNEAAYASICGEKEVLDKCKVLANKDHITFSQLVMQLLSAFLKKNGKGNAR